MTMSVQTCLKRQLMLLALLGACAREPALVDEPLPAPAARFLVGNETRHDLFTAALAHRGGAFLGVGGDACYTLMALASSERAYLIDHDPQVIALHRELGPRIAAATTPAAFLDLAPPLDPALREPWPAITAHLRRTAARPHTWLSDANLYTRAHTLWRAEVVHPVVGDLTGATAMPAIARAAASHDLQFTAIYLSNVEETLADRHALDDNLAALPRARDAIVLRTLHRPDWPAADLWSYQTHDLTALLNRDRDTLTTLATILDAAATLRFDPQAPALSAITAPR